METSLSTPTTARVELLIYQRVSGHVLPCFFLNMCSIEATEWFRVFNHKCRNRNAQWPPAPPARACHGSHRSNATSWRHSMVRYMIWRSQWNATIWLSNCLSNYRIVGMESILSIYIEILFHLWFYLSFDILSNCQNYRMIRYIICIQYRECQNIWQTSDISFLPNILTFYMT